MRRLYYLIALIILPFTATSQHWEVGGLIGGSNYIGDLSHHNLYMSETNFAGGMIIRYNLTNRFTIKGNIYAGQITGDDANASEEEYLIRNLSFKSFLLDIGMQGEYFLFGYGRNPGTYHWAPYVFGGISLFRFNPQAEYEGVWYDLQPLGTEGQETTRYQERQKYSLTQMSVPVGFGIKHSLDRHWNIGFEFGYRITFTDYLDDVSTTYIEDDILAAAHGSIATKLANRTGEVLDERLDLGPQDPRGDPTRNDHYMFFGVTISYILYTPDCFRF